MKPDLKKKTNKKLVVLARHDMPTNLAHGRLRQEAQEFKASFSYLASPRPA